MREDGEERKSAHDAPEPRSPVGTRRRKEATVRRERDVANGTVVPERVEERARLHVPDMHGVVVLIAAARNQQPVRTELRCRKIGNRLKLARCEVMSAIEDPGP